MILAATKMGGDVTLHLTGFELLIGCLVGIATLLAIAAAALRWVYHQGSAAAEQVTAVRANTRATEDLSAAFKIFSEKVDGTLTDLAGRVSRLETLEEIRSARP
jgi:hypothetical protein